MFVHLMNGFENNLQKAEAEMKRKHFYLVSGRTMPGNLVVVTKSKIFGNFRNSFTCLVCFLIVIQGKIFSQQLEVNLTDGKILQYNLQSIRRISFNADSMLLDLKDGSRYSKLITDIVYYKYKEENTGAGVQSSTSEPWELSLSPNPVSELIQVDFYLPYDQNLSYSIVDMSGKQILNGTWDLLNAGNQSKQISLKELIPGSYLLCIHGKNEIVSKKIIKN